MLEIIEQAKGYKYNSLNYIDSDQLIDAEVVYKEEGSTMLLKSRRDREELCWAAETKEDFFKAIKYASEYFKIKHENSVSMYIEFIPEEFLEGMNELDFDIYSEWIDFWIVDLNAPLDKDGEASRNAFSDKLAVRGMKLSDVEDAKQVFKSCIETTRGFIGSGAADFINYLDDENAISLVALENGQVLGVCNLSVYGFDSERGITLWFEEIAVSPEHQGKGIGKALMAAALEWGRSKDAKRSFLAADVMNCGAIKLYEKFGYKADPGRGQINMIK